MMARRTEISPIAEAQIVKAIDHWLDLIAAAMTNEGGRLVMRNEFLRQLQASGAATLPTDIIMEAAEAGNAAADVALRAFIADCVNHGVEMSAQLRAYNVRALLRPPVHYPRGSSDTADTWTRDIGLCVLIDLTAQRWQLLPTRGRTTPEPAAAYFVGKAVARRGFKLKEQQLTRIYRRRGELAARIAASLFPATGAF
jgi:hypothetical protein